MKHQPIADSSCVVIIHGHREETLQDIWDNAAPRSRKTINPRTGRYWTEFSELRGPFGNGNDWTMHFVMKRFGIRGNWENDCKEFIVNAANSGKKNRRVEVDVERFHRTLV